jgi:hypothetical protein
MAVQSTFTVLCVLKCIVMLLSAESICQTWQCAHIGGTSADALNRGSWMGKQAQLHFSNVPAILWERMVAMSAGGSVQFQASVQLLAQLQAQPGQASASQLQPACTVVQLKPQVQNYGMK